MDAYVGQVERLRNHSLGNPGSSRVAIHDAELVQQLVLPWVPAKLAHSLEDVGRKRVIGDNDTRPRPLKFLIENLLRKGRLPATRVAGDQHRGGVRQTSSYELVESFEGGGTVQL